MTEKTKKLSDRIREALDTLVEVAESLLVPPPEPIPVPVRRPRVPPRRRR